MEKSRDEPEDVAAMTARQGDDDIASPSRRSLDRDPDLIAAFLPARIRWTISTTA